MLEIITPTTIENVAWKGILERTGDTYRASEVPTVSLAEPTGWTLDNEAMKSKTGEDWIPPDDNKRYKLLRLAFTLHELQDTDSRYTEAMLNVFLKPPAKVIAHDLYPLNVSAEGSKKSTSVELGSSLKFTEAVSLSGPKAGVKIESQEITPVVQAFGLGESNPYWKYKDSERKQLLGSQFAYLVLAAPQETERVELGIEINAVTESRFGFGLFSSELAANPAYRCHSIQM